MKFLVGMIFFFALGSATRENTTGQKSNPLPQCYCSMTCQGNGTREMMRELLKKVEDNGKNVQANGKKVQDNGKKIDALEKRLVPPRISVTFEANGTREIMSELMKKVQDYGKKIDALEKKLFPTRIVGKNCAELYRKGYKQDGVYTINPDGMEEFQVYCDQKTSGGGWIIFQRRLDGSVYFYRGWNDYKNGFGDVRGEYWLGLEKINRLTRLGCYRLRVDLEDTSRNWRYAEYENFSVLGEQTNYKLSIGKYTGTAGDSLSYHNNRPFTTKDRDHDGLGGGSCAQDYKGAWWYNRCLFSNLNGLYHYGYHTLDHEGVNWQKWKGSYYSLKGAEMKVRPMSY